MAFVRKESTGAQGSKLMCGVFNCEVIAGNPTAKELADLKGYELNPDTDEFKYSGITNDIDWVDLAFVLDVKGDLKWKPTYKIRISNKELKSKNGEKTQYVNQMGVQTWVDDESNLKESFTMLQKWDNDKKQFVFVLDEGGNKIPLIYRKALQGEVNLYTFLKALLPKIATDNIESNFLVDVKKLFRDPTAWIQSEYISELKKDESESLEGWANGKKQGIVGLAMVHPYEKDGESKNSQAFYSEWIPGYQWKNVNAMTVNNNWHSAEKSLKKWKENLDKAKEKMSDVALLVPLQEFSNDMALQTSNRTIQSDEPIEDTSY